MLFVVTGSSCSGKTTIAESLAVGGLDVHDSDDRGVPDGADLQWRQRDLEQWVQLALDRERDSTDVLLTTQSPLGEVLAAPSATRLSGVAVCLLDVEDRTRWLRLEQRDPGTWSSEHKRRFIGWARWHRRHAADPSFTPAALMDGAWSEMCWDRWVLWTEDDSRWNTEVIDTSNRSIAECVADVAAWIASVRSDREWPLRLGWIDR